MADALAGKLSFPAMILKYHHHILQVAIGLPHILIEYLCWLVVCRDVA